MQQAGYKTYYTGKLMNGHDQNNWNRPRPGGLDGNDFLIGPGKRAELASKQTVTDEPGRYLFIPTPLVPKER